MSLAGIRSNRGDTYQRSVALYWCVKILSDDAVSGVLVDVVSLPDEEYLIYGDDIVVQFADGKKHFIQAKVNQSSHQSWELSNSVLKKELIAARNQLISAPLSEFHFYSRTPFHTLQRLIEEIPLHPDFDAFEKNGPKNQQKTLRQLASIWETDLGSTFSLVKRLKIGDHHSSTGWEEYCLALLQTSFSRPETALELIYGYVDRQHSKLGEPLFLIDRQEILTMLEQHGVYFAANFNEQKLIDSFNAVSLQGRQWVRTIGGVRFIREETELLVKAIYSQESTVLLEDIAGGGKTCILLDLMDYLDTQEEIVTLFIKGDLFASIESLSELTNYGLPENVIQQCAYLAGKHRLVVVIDSMDVLAVGRSHKSLQCFLALIAALEHVPNITIIAASRSFDAKYDPLLREMSWSTTVTVAPLSFDSDISPLFEKWGIDPGTIGRRLRNLLIIPQNLKLFYDLINKGIPIDDIEEHDLYDLYFQEIVENDQHLGSKVVEELQRISSVLLSQRSYQFPQNYLQVSSQQKQRLLSQQVLTETGLQLMFSHQTLADALRIRQAQKDGISLADFVLSQPQLPFIRSAVRTFILALRGTQPDQFNKQLQSFLFNDSVAMHLKRLAVETLAEMSAKEDDCILITAMASRSPSLFNRFLDSATNSDWFHLLHDHWIPFISQPILHINGGTLLRFFSKFLDQNEEILISLWNRAIDEQWMDSENLAWQASRDLQKIKRWDVPGLNILIEQLLEINQSGRDYLGKLICRCIEVTGVGDELLWKFITRGSCEEGENDIDNKLNINCQKHEFTSDNFLEKRMHSSDVLFSSAVDYLIAVTSQPVEEDDHYPFARNYIDSTSYEMRHNKYSLHHLSSTRVFFKAIESAMKIRARRNDVCWLTYEPKLRTSSELAIRYMLCESYLCNIEDNIEGIAYQLTDPKLLRYGNLEYELGRIVAKVYPYLNSHIQDAHQKITSGMYDDGEDAETCTDSYVYQHLAWVPVNHRLPELYDLYSRCEKRYGRYLPTPRIYGRGGSVISPISAEELISFDHPTLIKILRHYNDYDGWGEMRNEDLIGGRDSLEGALSTAASWVPMHFYPLIHEICNLKLAGSYITSIIDGISLHLRCRFGNLSSAGWKAVEPLPAKEELAGELLNLVERYCIYDSRGYTSSRAIEALSLILTDSQSLERVYFQAWKLGLHSNPDPDKDNETKDLVSCAINSVRGVIADSCMVICCNQLEAGKELDSNLVDLLFRYAKDPSRVVQAAFSRRLPYFHSKQPELGWSLLQLLLQDAQPDLLFHFERALYYQYHGNFDNVKPYLEMLKGAGHKECSAAWGRLATLSYLSGHLSEDELWVDFDNMDEDTITGIAKVFTANLDSAKSSAECVKGLSRLLIEYAPKAVFSTFEFSLEREDKSKFVPITLIEQFVEFVPADHAREIDGVFHWLEKHVQMNPGKILELLEKIISRLDELTGHIYIVKPETLITTIKFLLMEADLSDDIVFIDRVLTVQDWFLDHGVSELSELLEAA